MKYKRSIEKMTGLLEEIFQYDGIARDSKIILSVLAATMPLMRFNRLVNNIDQIHAIRGRLQEINVLRHQYGYLYRDYILIYALQDLDTDISKQELDRFLS